MAFKQPVIFPKEILVYWPRSRGWRIPGEHRKHPIGNRRAGCTCPGCRRTGPSHPRRQYPCTLYYIIIHCGGRPVLKRACPRSGRPRTRVPRTRVDHLKVKCAAFSLLRSVPYRPATPATGGDDAACAAEGKAAKGGDHEWTNAVPVEVTCWFSVERFNVERNGVCLCAWRVSRLNFTFMWARRR